MTITTHPAAGPSASSSERSPMEFCAGHIPATRIVHLTQTSFLLEGLCGSSVELDGEPDLALICEACDRLGREAGGNPDAWVVTTAVPCLDFPAAA